ncbi:putative immunity/bacteriocin fusion bifunctional protein [Neobacillus sp. PS3-40]|uniref:putative immunity/bacteriocin fusion bifunctional protein n=1 Tax=Neobacillus sp. PS3-40 TaxID=3070679 RepID=UPI0027DF1007|nr:putative immunity/bacteriocin fusion bifunctional protein [Neobacillus sp. PS3-40]WML43847.1 putative immunity/bacteriocin fusion bifunctional protein [Neobacillus sp. PS3-40]
MLKKAMYVGMALMVLLLTLFTGQPIKTKASVIQTACPSCADLDSTIAELAKAGTTTNLEVDNKTKSQINRLVKTKDKDFFLELEQLKKDDFKEENMADNYITFENLTDKGITYKSVGVYTSFFIQKGNQEVARKQVWVDLEKDEVVRYDVFKFNGKGDSSKIALYDKNQESSSQLTAYSFKFNGVSFACSMAGIIACTAAFGGLAFFFPIIGGVASLGCYIAFNIGCSYT